VGGNGHMADIPVAAFDPIFYLHHCSIDRLLSLWSAVHPDVWVSPDRGQNENTALIPFWNSPKSMWSSSHLQDTTQFSYTYPELQGVDMKDPSTPAYIMSVIEYLYNNGPQPTPIRRAVGAMQVETVRGIKASSDTDMMPASTGSKAPVVEMKVQEPPKDVSNPVASASIATEPTKAFETINWTARLRFDQFEVDRSFTIFVFFCKESEIPDDPKEWYTCPNLAGCNDVFVNSKPKHCANCQDNTDLATEDYVQLDDALLESVQTVEKDVVIPFLKENLHWRVAKIDGTVVNLTSLEIVVIAAPVSRGEDDIFPSFGDPHHIHEIISGRN